MKNIVIVTWIGGGNYGTSLQSFSLHKKLEDLGYNTSIVIPLMPKNNTVKNLLSRMIYLMGVDIEKIKRFVKGDNRTVKQRRLDIFEEKYYRKKIIYFPIQLAYLNKSTDVYVTGSDQIWNTAYRFDRFYFLDFAGNVKRIAYASSMGINDFPSEHKGNVKQLLSEFYRIGVREETAVKAVSNLLGRDDIYQVLDPTFLLDGKEWTELSNRAEIEMELPKKYIFCYFIGNNPWYQEEVEVVQKATGIDRIIQVRFDENNGLIVKNAFLYNGAGPFEFVKLIKEASLVCTDSFHATAISINLEKNFVEFMRFKDSDNSSQNSRIYDVLNHYGLNRSIFSMNRCDWKEPIDFANVTKQLNSDRKKSLNFLIKAIEG